MRIAQLAPLVESVPPQFYGGTERIVSYLTESLIRMGHEVTLFASGDSQTRARLVPVCPNALHLEHRDENSMAFHVLMMEKLAAQRDQFDLIHSHLDYVPFPIARRLGLRLLTTLHGRLDLSRWSPLRDEFSEMPLVSISHAQRRPLPNARWIGTVYHGLPVDLLTLRETPERHLVFLGRLSKEKGVDRAIRIAEAAGVPLKIAAKKDPEEPDYFSEVFEPLLQTTRAEYVGEITETEKNDFLGHALGLLFPIDWPEPFGLVLIEAMACGTPIIAYRRGSVPEIVEDGVTGFVVDNEAQAVEAIAALPRLNRRRIRQRFEERFTDRRMAREYSALYERLLTEAIPSSLAVSSMRV